jgi:4'-phosphopantetheinyl transferase
VKPRAETVVDPQMVHWRSGRPGDVSLEADSIHLWRIGLDGLPEAVLETRRRCLSLDEIERARRFATPLLRDRFIACRGALRILLGGYTGRPAAALILEQGPFGKPALASPAPGETAPLVFNVSHSDAFALAALTLTRPIGVDLERVRALPDADQLAAQNFGPGEQSEYLALLPEWRPTGFFQCWTRKEAFIKATGEGLSRSLASFQVTLGPCQLPQIVHIDGDGDLAREWSLHAFIPETGYMAALAAHGRDLTFSFFEF